MPAKTDVQYTTSGQTPNLSGRFPWRICVLAVVLAAAISSSRSAAQAGDAPTAPALTTNVGTVWDEQLLPSLLDILRRIRKDQPPTLSIADPPSAWAETLDETYLTSGVPTDLDDASLSALAADVQAAIPLVRAHPDAFGEPLYSVTLKVLQEIYADSGRDPAELGG